MWAKYVRHFVNPPRLSKNVKADKRRDKSRLDKISFDLRWSKEGLFFWLSSENNQRSLVINFHLKYKWNTILTLSSETFSSPYLFTRNNALTTISKSKFSTRLKFSCVRRKVLNEFQCWSEKFVFNVLFLIKSSFYVQLFIKSEIIKGLWS